MVFSGDGSEEGTSGLVVLDLVDGARRQLTTDGATGAVWSPDGTRILAYLPSRRVEVIDVTSGTQLTRIPDPGVQWVVGWTPDGESVIYHACGQDLGKVECGEASHLVARADGTNVRTYSGPEPSAPGSGLPSPDGRWVVSTGPGGQLRVFPSSGGASVELGIGSDPSWSPDSAWVVFVSGEAEPIGSAEGPSNSLVIVARGGGPVIDLTHGRFDSKPAWQP